MFPSKRGKHRLKECAIAFHPAYQQRIGGKKNLKMGKWWFQGKRLLFYKLKEKYPFIVFLAA